MIEDRTSEEIYQVPELQELLQEPEERYYEPELSWDEKLDFALEVSEEEEYQPI